MKHEHSEQWKQENRGWCERKDVHPEHCWTGLYIWWCPGVDCETQDEVAQGSAV